MLYTVCFFWFRPFSYISWNKSYRGNVLSFKVFNPKTFISGYITKLGESKETHCKIQLSFCVQSFLTALLIFQNCVHQCLLWHPFTGLLNSVLHGRCLRSRYQRMLQQPIQYQIYLPTVCWSKLTITSGTNNIVCSPVSFFNRTGKHGVQCVFILA